MSRTSMGPTLAFGVLLTLGSAAHAAEVVGDWIVADQSAKIRIAACGKALCGTVVWTKTPGGVDVNNPDPARRNQPFLGLEVIKGMTPVGPNRWEGSVYNARDGKTYTAALLPQNAGTLKIEGCVLGGLLCGGETWTRAPETTGTVAASPAGTARPRAPSPR